jgi:hypothetical protein
MTIGNDDRIRAFLADDARRAIAAAPSLDEAVGRLAPRIERRPSGASRRLVVLLAATLLLVAALGTAIAVGSGILRLPLVIDDPEIEPMRDLGIFEPVAGRIVYYAASSLWAVDPSAPSTASTLVRLGPEGTADADRQFASFTVPLGWSSDGTELLFIRQDPTDQSFPYDRHLFILHADGTETQVTPEPVGGAAISPDGSRVAFAADGDDGLYVVDAEGGQPVRIANGEEPTFSPDGTQIAYLSLPRDGCCVSQGREHVWVANADGTDAHEILADEPALAEGVFELTWSPAGDRIAMGNSLEGHVAIYTFAPDGSDFTKVITGAAKPYWSPDGSQIAYVMLEGTSGLSIADADGSNVRTFDFGNPGPWHPGKLATPDVAPSPSTSPRPSPSPGFSRFNSTIHGISVDYPSGWQIRPASEPWNHVAFTFDAPGVDVIFDPTHQDDLYFSLASEPLGGQSAEDWCCSEPLGAAGVCGAGSNMGSYRLDVVARGWILDCLGQGDAGDHVVVVATATRGYVIQLHVGDDPILQATYNEDWFDAALETVDLRAE